MREASEKRKELEREHSEALTELRDKQNAVQRKLGNTSEKSKACESIESLQVGVSLFIDQRYRSSYFPGSERTA